MNTPLEDSALNNTVEIIKNSTKISEPTPTNIVETILKHGNLSLDFYHQAQVSPINMELDPRGKCQRCSKCPVKSLVSET